MVFFKGNFQLLCQPDILLQNNHIPPINGGFFRGQARIAPGLDWLNLIKNSFIRLIVAGNLYPSQLNPAELDKYLDEIISCQKNAEIISKVLQGPRQYTLALGSGDW